MNLHQAARDGQSETETALRAIKVLMLLHEQVEHAGQHVRRDPDAGIEDPHDDLVVVFFGADRDESSLLAVLGGVGQEVRHDLRQTDRIAVDV
jgi:hypothetical protein